MSKVLLDFIKICSEPNFWEDDMFMETSDISKNLQSEDWKELKLQWFDLTKYVKENILLSLTDNTNRQEQISFSYFLLNNHEKNEAINIFTDIRTKIESATDQENYLDLAFTLWNTCPQKRPILKQSIWSTGNSNIFLKKYNLLNWD